jgi:hypothetical protein
MQTTVVTRINIAASQTAVFRYLAHLKYHYLWNPQIQRISTQEPLKLGSTYESMSLVMGVKIKAKNTVTKFEPPRLLELENRIGAVQYQAHFRLHGQLNKTTLVCSITLSTDSNAFVFTKSLLKKLAQRELQTDMQALKIAVENQLE